MKGENIMYNEIKKDEFLLEVKEDSYKRNSEKYGQDKAEEVSNGVVESYKRIFKNSERLESKQKKDLSNFDLKEISKLMKEDMKPSTKASARTSGRIITKYINWSIEKGYSTYKTLEENPLNVKQDFFNQFVPSENTQFLSVDEVKDVLYLLINSQDAVIISLLFNGVQGKQASEIRNLTKNDVKISQKKLRVLDDKTGEYRVVDLSNDKLGTIKLINSAYNEPDYIKKNGKMEYSENIKDSVALPTPAETDYIIKTGKTHGKHYGERATQYTVYNRIDMIKALEDFEDISEKLTTKNIVRSGMIFEAKLLLDNEGGELDNDKLKRICEKFNVKNYWAIKDYVNMEVIESLYGKREELATV